MPFANISALLPCPFTGKGLGKGVGRGRGYTIL